MENIPFFISPPYHVFRITCSRLVMLNTTAVSEFSPQLFVVLNFGLGRVVYNEIRLEVLQFFLCGDDEHVLNEMSLPCNFHDETDRHAGVGVGAAECVYYEKSLVGEFLKSDIFNSVPCLNGSRMVVVLVFIGCPPYSVLGILVHNDEFVFR